MAGAFGLYLIAHSPLREVIAGSLGVKSRAYYFICANFLTFNRAADLLSAWTLIVAAILAAWIVSDWFEGPTYERPLTFGLSGLGFISVPAAIIGGVAEWNGQPSLRSPQGPLLVAAPAIFVIVAGVVRGWRPKCACLAERRFSGLIVLCGILASALLMVSITVSFTHPPTSYDALSFHAPMAVFLWRDGNLGAFLDRTGDFKSLAHPGTANLWFGLLLVAGHEGLANIGQLPFAVLGSSAIHAFARRLGLTSGPALLAALAYLLAPIVIIQSGVQLTDVFGSGVLMATMALACAPPKMWTFKRLSFIGLGLGLVASSKLALLPCVAAVGFLAIPSVLKKDGHWSNARTAMLRFVMIALVFFTVVAPWWLRNMARYGNPVYPAALPLIGRGVPETDSSMKDREFVPSPAAWVLYPLIEPLSEYSGFGLLFVLGAIPGVGFAVMKGRRRPFSLYAFTTLVMVAAWWRLTRHEPRFLLPIFGLGFAFLPWSLLALPRGQRRIGSALFALAAVYSGLVTLDQSLLPLSRQPSTRMEFYDRVWGVDPIIASLPESEGLLHNTGYAAYTYPAYYPLLGPSLTRSVIPVDADDASVESIIATMRTSGLHYAYVTASPQMKDRVEAKYDNSRFELVHTSAASHGWIAGTRRYLYHLKNIEPVVPTPGTSSNH
jgi:hypothetical protein